jgi:5-methylcytosine-specific restriction endonuclease McrA
MGECKCARCGKEYVAKHYRPNRLYCSPCAVELKSERRKARHYERECPNPGVGRGGAHFRSERPSCKVAFLVCEECEESFVARNGGTRPVCGKRECNLSAGRKRTRQINAAKKVMQPKPCKCGCGAIIVPVYGDKRRTFDTHACNRRYVRRNTPGRNTHRARAKKYGAQYEYINPSKVLERDGYICQVCGIPTPIELRGTIEWDAPELGHIVALCDGGPHTWSNVQCECRRCNNEKEEDRRRRKLAA